MLQECCQAGDACCSLTAELPHHIHTPCLLPTAAPHFSQSLSAVGSLLRADTAPAPFGKTMPFLQPLQVALQFLPSLS